MEFLVLASFHIAAVGVLCCKDCGSDKEDGQAASVPQGPVLQR